MIDQEALQRAIEASDRHRQLAVRRATLQQTLRDSGDGLSLEELARQAAGQDIDALPGKIEAAKAQVLALRQSLDQALSELAVQMSRERELDGSAQAAAAQERTEHILARMRNDVERYVQTRAAAHILRTQIEQFRRSHQTPLLARASAVFSRLTLGGFKGLKDDVDERGQPVVVGVRADGREILVSGMSDGTRDQLHLALRLAALEWRLDQGQVVPFVVDDILIGFDDERSRAALEVLVEVAAKTQVLLFTHHRRVVELAGEIEQGDGVLVHQL